jgi:hypothetical protein
MTAEFKKCWMLKIYTGEDVIVGNDPLYRTILEEARRLKIAGATVIKGIEGYATEVRRPSSGITFYRCFQPACFGDDRRSERKFGKADPVFREKGYACAGVV